MEEDPADADAPRAPPPAAPAAPLAPMDARRDVRPNACADRPSHVPPHAPARIRGPAPAPAHKPHPAGGLASRQPGEVRGPPRRPARPRRGRAHEVGLRGVRQRRRRRASRVLRGAARRAVALPLPSRPVAQGRRGSVRREKWESCSAGLRSVGSARRGRREAAIPLHGRALRDVAAILDGLRTQGLAPTGLPSRGHLYPGAGSGRGLQGGTPWGTRSAVTSRRGRLVAEPATHGGP